MLQSKQRLLELNAKLAETLANKGVTATADETTTELINKTEQIINDYDDKLISIIQRDITEITIPEGVDKISTSAFSGCYNLTKVIIPDSVTLIGSYAFNTCSNLPSIVLPNSVTVIYAYAFINCTNLTDIVLPNSVTSITNNVFNNCTALKDVILGDGFNANNLNLSASTQYTKETIVRWLNALADRTGKTAYTLTIGATNLAKLTEEDILIATNKNWTLA